MARLGFGSGMETSEAHSKATSPVERLRRSDPLITVELRPPRSGLSHQASIDTWIDMYHSIRRLSREDTLVYLTDNAVGQNEEENLHH